jgi:hypothetical protein
VGMGGEYVRLMSAALGTQPAARNAALLRTAEFTLIRRSPTPSFIEERYAVRSWYRTKLRGLVEMRRGRWGPTLRSGGATWLSVLLCHVLGRVLCVQAS